MSSFVRGEGGSATASAQTLGPSGAAKQEDTNVLAGDNAETVEDHPLADLMKNESVTDDTAQGLKDNTEGIDDAGGEEDSFD